MIPMSDKVISIKMIGKIFFIRVISNGIYGPKANLPKGYRGLILSPYRERYLTKVSQRKGISG
jgi:hypothetical protein